MVVARPIAETCTVYANDGAGRVWSWAASRAEADARQHDADLLVGETIRTVRYFTLDYRRDELHPDLNDSGPRTIDAQSERDQPTWLYDGFDALDYGFEVITESGQVFSLTWDPPGLREGIGLQPVPMLGTGVRSDANVAIWTVEDRTAAWALMVNQRVVGVDLHYRSWDEGGESLWCPHVTLRGERGRLEVVMGDAERGALVPSADNVAVLHPSRSLPPWSESSA